ncbi:Calmodulin [Euphorbia peplus]|nr:Calmodulin [Euphorbia peplus]
MKNTSFHSPRNNTSFPTVTHETADMKSCFPSVTHKITEIPIAEEQLKRIFMMFDKNNDKILCKEEIKKAFEFLGAKFPGFRAYRGIRNADVNGDGQVDLEELDHLAKYASTLGYFLK